MADISVAKWINNIKPGSVFSAKDIPSSISRGVRDEMLSRFARQGRIRRLVRGIYATPIWSNLLKRNVYPGPEDVAKTLARKFGWTIMPCDDAAMNGLGLSTQVPARYIYLSDGPTKKYMIDGCELEFRHRCLRETSGLIRSDSKLVIRAIKGLGPTYATPDVVSRIAAKFSADEWRMICEDSAKASDWISRLLWDEMERKDSAK